MAPPPPLSGDSLMSLDVPYHTQPFSCDLVCLSTLLNCCMTVSWIPLVMPSTVALSTSLVSTVVRFQPSWTSPLFCVFTQNTQETECMDGRFPPLRSLRVDYRDN